MQPAPVAWPEFMQPLRGSTLFQSYRVLRLHVPTFDSPPVLVDALSQLGSVPAG